VNDADSTSTGETPTRSKTWRDTQERRSSSCRSIPREKFVLLALPIPLWRLTKKMACSAFVASKDWDGLLATLKGSGMKGMGGAASHFE